MPPTNDPCLWPIPQNESERLAELESLYILDTPEENPFDGLVEIAAALFSVPVALVTFIEHDRQWFKAHLGAPFTSTPRELAFCSHTIMSNETMVVENFLLDDRFKNHPFVAGGPGARFYAGTPVVMGQHCVGTVCILDFNLRTFSQADKRLLERLASTASDALESRRLIRLLGDSRSHR